VVRHSTGTPATCEGLLFENKFSCGGGEVTRCAACGERARFRSYLAPSDGKVVPGAGACGAPSVGAVGAPSGDAPNAGKGGALPG